MIKTCKNCGKKFYAEHGNKKYCSEECTKASHRNSQRNHYLEFKAVNRPQKKICPVCGVEFESNRKTCSAKCSRALYKQKLRSANCLKKVYRKKIKPDTVRVCKECGKKLELSKGLSQSSFCSMGCDLKNLSKNKNLYTTGTYKMLYEMVHLHWAKSSS